MSDRGDRLSSSRSGQLLSSGQLVWVDYACPPTSEGHNSFVRTSIQVFLDSMESPLSQEFINRQLDKIGTHISSRKHGKQ